MSNFEDQCPARDHVANHFHKHAQSRRQRDPLTTSNGAPIDSITATMTAGPRGDIVLKDFAFLDHMAAFDRERIPERVVHAKGAGAFGHFEVTSTEITKYCKAKLFESVGKKTPLAVRFSTVGGESGSADTVRDPRGFAVKFYTEEGNWDLVGNNTPIFFIRDPILFPSFIHTQKRNPSTHCKDPDMMWDFISLRPETIHQVSFLFSDRGIPDGYRHMHGYGSHTFKTVNAAGEAFYVKWHFRTDQGIKNLSVEKANELAGSDPDYSIRDLYNAIASEDYPSWTLQVQVMTFAQAERCPFNPFDVTKVWPHSEFPLITVGKMTLTRNPINYFNEIEQIAFAPAHMVPGIEPSPDKMLQGRLFSYADTHRHRLGVNYQSIPVNCPFMTRARTYHRDGSSNIHTDGNVRFPSDATEHTGGAHYFPNSFHGPQPDPSKVWHASKSTGDVRRYESGESEDNFTQCGIFFRKVLNDEERRRLVDNIAGNLAQAQDFIIERALANFAAADNGYGRMLREKVAEIKAKNGTASKKRSCPFAKSKM